LTPTPTSARLPGREEAPIPVTDTLDATSSFRDDSLTSDRQRRDALLWTFTVLGEAAAQLPDELKADYPEIPCQQPPRLRKRIVHGYWSIDLDILITTAAERLPSMVEQLRNAHEELDQP
jgi:uncharacterized protein with HEPN domain